MKGKVEKCKGTANHGVEDDRNCLIGIDLPILQQGGDVGIAVVFIQQLGFDIRPEAIQVAQDQQDQCSFSRVGIEIGNLLLAEQRVGDRRIARQMVGSARNRAVEATLLSLWGTIANQRFKGIAGALERTLTKSRCAVELAQ